MQQEDGLLTLKEASSRLGVHPNTLRNWERAGLIHMVRLPGSQHRRVPLSEVRRVRAQMRLPQPLRHGVRMEPPPTDPAAVAEGRALASAVKQELAGADQGQSLEQYMRRLRGRLWL